MKKKQSDYIFKPCPRCWMLHSLDEYECERCGWEFGFEGGGPDSEDTPHLPDDPMTSEKG